MLSFHLNILGNLTDHIETITNLTFEASFVALEDFNYHILQSTLGEEIPNSRRSKYE